MGWNKIYTKLTKDTKIRAGDYVRLDVDTRPNTASWTNKNVGREFKVIRKDYDQLYVRVEFEDFAFPDDIDEENDAAGYVECADDIENFSLVKG